MMKSVILLSFSLASGLALSNSVPAQSSAKTNSVQTKRASSADKRKDEVVSEIKRLENELARAVVARDYAALPRTM